jgi:vacuolar-type H+-ATPase subunit I/STV1
MGGMGSGSSGHPNTTMNDMQKMMAVQATDEQKSQFQSWNQNTAALKQQLEELRRAAATGDYSSQLDSFKAAVEKNNSGHHEFAGSLTQAQQAGLKKPLQKLGKTNDELAQALATATREISQADSNAKRAAKLTKVEKAVDTLLREQKEIASEMGIV